MDGRSERNVPDEQDVKRHTGRAGLSCEQYIRLSEPRAIHYANEVDRERALMSIGVAGISNDLRAHKERSPDR